MKEFQKISIAFFMVSVFLLAVSSDCFSTGNNESQEDSKLTGEKQNDATPKMSEELEALVSQAFALGAIPYSVFAEASRNMGEKDIDSIYLLAHKCFSNDIYPVAEALFSKLVVIRPFRSDYWRALGAVYQQKESYGMAIGAYNIALLLNPEDMTSLCYRGESRIKSCDPGRGKVDLKKVSFSKNTEQFGPWIERSKLLMNLKEKINCKGKSDLQEKDPCKLSKDMITYIDEDFRKYLDNACYLKYASYMVQCDILSKMTSSSEDQRVAKQMQQAYYTKLGLK